MTIMMDRNPEGRDIGEGFEAAVQAKTVEELLAELIHEVRALHYALRLGGMAEDIGHFTE